MKISNKLFFIILRSLCAAAISLVIYWSPVSAAADQLPEDGIAKFNSSLLEVMKNAATLGIEGRYRLLEPVVKEVFSLPFMASKSIGSHWKNLTPKQRDQYIEVYSEWTIATYAGRFDGYDGESFIQSRSADLKQESVPVKSSILKATGESIVDFNYIMRKFPSTGWQIVDIRILGVSQLAMTRAQFVDIMKKDGFDAMISMMRKKTKAFYGKGI
jgi:phospholipid transport system substrate-binding protein